VASTGSVRVPSAEEVTSPLQRHATDRGAVLTEAARVEAAGDDRLSSVGPAAAAGVGATARDVLVRAAGVPGRPGAPVVGPRAAIVSLAWRRGNGR